MASGKKNLSTPAAWLAFWMSINVAGIAAGQAAVGFSRVRPFVVGVVPVVGNGAVGGIEVDAQGVVSRPQFDEAGRLAQARRQGKRGRSTAARLGSRMRKVSLRLLQSALAERRGAEKPPTDQMQYLAGLTRLRYVFVFPEQRDVVLAGPAETWEVDPSGEARGTLSGRPPIRLEHLLAALRAVFNQAADITCSIDPQAERVARLQAIVTSGRLTQGPKALSRLKRVLGPHQVTLTGVDPASHFARVMLTADMRIKSLALGWERSPEPELPSYLDMLRQAGSVESLLPRWWLAPRYRPVLQSADGLAWQLRIDGVVAMTSESKLGAGGLEDLGEPGTVAGQWAEEFTRFYEELSQSRPSLIQLVQCMDLAAASALLAHQRLPQQAECPISALLSDKEVPLVRYPVPKTLTTEASYLKQRQNWIVALSGGVDLGCWEVVSEPQKEPNLAKLRSAARPHGEESWWWD